MKDRDGARDVAECERRLAECEAENGPSHVNTSRALFDLVLALGPLHRYDEAIVLCRHAFDIVLAHHDDDWWRVSMIRGALGCLLSEAGRADEALPLLRHEAELADRSDEPSGRVPAHWFLGQALMRAARWSEAIASFEIVLPIVEQRNHARRDEQIATLRAWIAEARAKLSNGS